MAWNLYKENNNDSRFLPYELIELPNIERPCNCFKSSSFKEDKDEAFCSLTTSLEYNHPSKKESWFKEDPSLPPQNSHLPLELVTVNREKHSPNSSLKNNRSSRMQNKAKEGNVESKFYIGKMFKSRHRMLMVSFCVVFVGLCIGSVLGTLLQNHLSSQVTECSWAGVACRSTLCTGCQNETSLDILVDFDKQLDSFTLDNLLQEKPIRDKEGWVHFSKGSDKGSKYLAVNKLMTFFGAHDYCKKLGGHLTHINSVREQIFVEEFLKEELKTEQLPGSVGYWLGARRPRGGHSGACMFEQWKWVDSYGRSHGSIKGFTAFIPGKPDNLYSPEECLYIAYNRGFEEDKFLKWDDAPCDLQIFGGIKSLCEVELH